MEETETIKIEIKLNTFDMEKADKIMKKMLKSLPAEDLLHIGDCMLIKTIAEVEVNAKDI